MLTVTERPLTSAEAGDLARRLAKARKDAREAIIKTGGSSAVVCAILALVTLGASRSPWWVVVLFWSVLAIVFTVWTGLPWRRTMRMQLTSLDDALRASRARVTRVESPRVVQFEEEEDEGACYAFELDAGSCLFVVGQEFYEDDDFPNSDFSMIDLLGTRGQTIDTLLQKTGRKLTPNRVVPASVKHLVLIPEHMTTVQTPLDEVEHALGKQPGTYR